MKKIFLILIFILNFENLYGSNKISYIDINYILNNSKVGISISEHVKKIEEKKINEFNLIEKKLSDREKDILKKKSVIDNEEFENLVNSLKKDVNSYRQVKKSFYEEIEKKKIKYTKQVLNTLNPIIAKYVEDNAISLVLLKKNIVIAKKIWILQSLLWIY